MMEKLIFLKEKGKFPSMKQVKRLITAAAVLCIAGMSGYAENGDGKVRELTSPYLIGNGAAAASMTAPHALSVNPAAAALVQRLTFDGSYIGIIDPSDGSFGPKGHSLNFATLFPAKVGVFTASGNLLTASEMEAFDPGTQLSVYGAFSKDVYPDLFVGSGARVTFGDDGTFAAAADLGLIRRQGDYLQFSDFHWGVSLLDLGYSTIDADRRAPFTPRAGAEGTFIENETVTAKLRTDLSLPSFMNLRLGLGLGLTIGGSFNVGIGSRYDMISVADGFYDQLIPSVSISYTLRPGGTEDAPEDTSPFSSNEMTPHIAAAPMSDSLWAVGAGLTMPIGVLDKKAPEIELDLSAFSEEEEGDEAGPEAEADNENDAEEDNSEKVSTLSRKGPKNAKALRFIQEAKEGEKETGKKDNADQEEYQEILPPDALVYISPNNDGVKDSLEFPIKISDRRYLKEYEFVVTDEAGTPIRTIRNKEKRPEIRSVRTFFKNLFSKKKGVEVPETIRWDGNTDDGDVAPDGLYQFHLRAVDDNGNSSRSDTYTVYIDNTPPEVKIVEKAAGERIFSPNNDGNKDELPLEQDGSMERLWRGRIEDAAGTVVRTFRWSAQKPETVLWDGTNNDGILVPDGIYIYKIEARDRAGNTGSSEYGNIVKNTEQTPIALRINRSHFSPNYPEGDGSKDTLTLRPQVPVTTGIEKWKIEIINEAGEVKRIYEGNETAPQDIVFEGRDNFGGALAEGSYTAKIDVLYINGNNPQAESPSFVLDVTPPSVSVKADTKIFSPNGDGNKDEIRFYQETSVEDLWYGRIIRESEEGDITQISDYKWLEKAPSSFSWGGRRDDGGLAEDGDSYYYHVFAEDRAGNRGESKRIRFELSTKETPVFVSADLDAFSPNGDGVKDQIHFSPKLEVKEGIASYRLDVIPGETNAGGARPLRRFSGSRTVPERITWNGRNEDGDVVADGSYRIEMKVVYEQGNEENAAYGPFIVDTVFPNIEVQEEYELFSPNGDGRKDEVEFSQSGSREDLWQAEVNDSGGEVIATAFWKGVPGDFTWDGTDDAGNVVPDGRYTYRVFAEDKAGNRTEKRSNPVRIDTRPTKVFVTADTDRLSPNGDGKFEEIRFNTIINLTDGMESWYLEMVDNSSTVQKRFEGDQRIPKRVIWDGKNEAGDYREGVYTARFGVEYRKGNRPEALSLPFTLDISPPETRLSISPTPFSPDNDGADDELKIDIDVQDISPIESWRLAIYDTRNRLFKEFSGSGAPAEEIIWDGRADDGELVYSAMDYPYEFSVGDVLGNRRTVEGDIPVDVLVVREGNVLKIKIANINFQPNSAEFVEDDPEIAARISYVLDRVAEILKKYRQYKVTIEGHAVITRWYDEQAAAKEQKEELLPLSEKRAERVQRALTERGVPRSRLSTKGVGGSNPLVPHSDEENRWKNRRVEFILRKE